MEGLILLGSIFGLGIGLLILLFTSLAEEPKAFIIGLVVTLISALLFASFIVSSARCEKQPWERAEEPYVTHTIIALSDGNEIDGKFRGSRYCMSGYINEKFTYVYGYKTVGGGMKIQKAGADVSTVYFDDDIEPCAKWYRWTRKFWWCEQEKTTCDIYVPTDSLEASITIDLE